jgi:hypothetical protein
MEQGAQDQLPVDEGAVEQAFPPLVANAGIAGENAPTEAQDDATKTKATVRRIKRVRLLLDARIELTDDELKVCLLTRT